MDGQRMQIQELEACNQDFDRKLDEIGEGIIMDLAKIAETLGIKMSCWTMSHTYTNLPHAHNSLHLQSCHY